MQEQSYARAVFRDGRVCLLGLSLVCCGPAQSEGESIGETSESLAFAPRGHSRAHGSNEPRGPHELLNVVDTSRKKGVFRARLSLDEQDVMIDGRLVHATIYKDLSQPKAYEGAPDGIPVPQFVVDVGDVVVVSLRNDLEENCAAVACNTSIHFHGIEVDNDSDGTAVTQNHVAPGEAYTYRFIAPRPGIYSFHPRMSPGGQVFAGAYGAFIVRDPRERRLQRRAKIPSQHNTYTLVMSDIEFDADGDVGYVENSLDAVPWALAQTACAAGNMMACRSISDGDTVLINGQAGVAEIAARSGEGLRLRLLNTSTNRYFRLRVENNGGDDNLYRIGGEGGFLEQVRLEGGMLGSYDTKYQRGEILLPTSARTDVVLVPTGADGDVVTISGESFARGGPENANPGPGPLLRIRIDGRRRGRPFTIAEGDEVLGDGAIENLKGLAISDAYIDPAPNGGSSDPVILLIAMSQGTLSINGVPGDYEDSGDDYTAVPFQGASRYARVGDTLEVIVTTATLQHHPFHQHGFSFQPTRVIDQVAFEAAGDLEASTLYEFDYDEFVDVIDVPRSTTVDEAQIGMVVRMRLDDRPRITDTRQEAGAPRPGRFFAGGGAAGRWLFHSDIFLKPAIGMVSELVVFDADRDGDRL